MSTIGSSEKIFTTEFNIRIDLKTGMKGKIWRQFFIGYSDAFMGFKIEFL